VADVEAAKHQAIFSSSGSVWTNNKLGLVWLEQIFDCYTKKKNPLWEGLAPSYS
jgi:hypothetical protein